MESTCNIDIVLDSDGPDNSYFSGSNITGKIVVNSNQRLDIGALFVEIEGKAHVSWTEVQVTPRHIFQPSPFEFPYTAEEKFISTRFQILGETIVPPGKHIYPFSYLLPPNLPSSFTGKYGSIKYTLKGLVDGPWRCDQETTMKEFNVIALIDLNDIPSAMESVKKEGSNFICCFFCNQGSLSLIASLPYKGYIPGQAIVLQVEVDNASNFEIKSVKCILKKCIKWITENPQRHWRKTEEELNTAEIRNILPRGSITWTANIIVPDTAYPDNGKSRIILVKHVLEVYADPKGCLLGGLGFKIPLIIGTVPVRKEGAGITPIFPKVNLSVTSENDQLPDLGHKDSGLLKAMTKMHPHLIRDQPNSTDPSVTPESKPNSGYPQHPQLNLSFPQPSHYENYPFTLPNQYSDHPTVNTPYLPSSLHPSGPYAPSAPEELD